MVVSRACLGVVSTGVGEVSELVFQEEMARVLTEERAPMIHTFWVAEEQELRAMVHQHPPRLLVLVVPGGH